MPAKPVHYDDYSDQVEFYLRLNLKPILELRGNQFTLKHNPDFKELGKGKASSEKREQTSLKLKFTCVCKR